MELRIKEVCRAKKIGMQELADKLGISRQALHKRMNNNITVDSLKAIADAVGVDPIEFIVPGSDFAHFYDSGEWLGIRKK